MCSQGNGMRGMPIPDTAALIVKCWALAEEALRVTVKEKFPDRDEENITDLFHAELDVVLRRVGASYESSMQNLARARAVGRPPRPWRSPPVRTLR